MHRLTLEAARRLAVRAQLLTADRPDDLLDGVRHLGWLPVDMTAAVAPSTDLISWSRLGGACAPGDVAAALDDGDLVEYDAGVRVADDLALLRPEMAAWPPYESTRDWLAANELFRAEVLDVLDDQGPSLAREVHATPQVPFRSSGWNTSRSVSMMLRCLHLQGEVAVAGRQGNQPRWDLSERHWPEVPVVGLAEARRRRAERRLAALGIARASGTEISGAESVHVGDVGESATVEGTPGEWRIDPTLLDADFTGRTALLSPFDSLVRDRVRMEQIFEFEYVLEMYKPAAKRRWGYFALPVLHDDRLVGKLDATADRRAGRLVVDAVHEDGRWTKAMRGAVDAEIDALADWLGLPRG